MTASASPEPEARHPLRSIAAKALVKHVSEYLQGSLNEQAHEDWVLALARALEIREGEEDQVSLDEALGAIFAGYLKGAR